MSTMVLLKIWKDKIGLETEEYINTSYILRCYLQQTDNGWFWRFKLIDGDIVSSDYFESRDLTYEWFNNLFNDTDLTSRNRQRNIK